MTECGQNIYRLLHESTSAWLLSLSVFHIEAGRRQSALTDNLETPELSAHLMTTVGGSPVSATSESTVGPTHTWVRPCRPVWNRATVIENTYQTQCSPQNYDSLLVRDSRSRIAIVLYDSGAQETLAKIVQEIARMIYSIKKQYDRESFNDIVKQLEKASELCEDGAFQLLKSGQCRRNAQDASAVLESLIETSRKEVMKSQLAERLDSRGYAHVKSEPANLVMPKLQVEGLDIDGNDHESYTPLPPIRLTSRLVRS